MLSRLIAFVMSVTLLLFAYPNTTKAETLSDKTTFIVYGDLPYMITLADGRTDEEVLFEEIIPAINEHEEVPFVIHVGDLSRPEYTCSDELLQSFKDVWDNDIDKPIFYTPGDNDWTDCDREKLSNPQSELARLVSVRKIFFSEPKTLDREWQYEQNSDLPENTLWIYDGVLFVTEHMIGTNNGRDEILQDDPATILAEVDKRDQANREWLDHAFNLAQNNNVEAVVLASHLDPFGPEDGENDAFTRCTNKPAYAGFCQQIQTFAHKLQKPILYVHGDTNAYCYDKPFNAELAPNIWRLNAPGDIKYIDASLISYDRSNQDLPFEVTGLLSGEVPPEICDYSR
ncbi:MAG: hypothetical protein AB4057_09660 [Crocosphaera sp.]